MGQKFFARFSRDAFYLVCGDDVDSKSVRDQLLHALTDQSSFAALLAVAAVTYLGWSPALAAVGAMLITNLVVKNAKETLCEEWRTKLTIA
jgi:divalent metal cation (Fe/Co/Zn/Cd) transporter